MIHLNNWSTFTIVIIQQIKKKYMPKNIKILIKSNHTGQTKLNSLF
jgi:hypothetical protein